MLRFRIEPGTAQTTKVFLTVDGGDEIDVSAMVCKATTLERDPAVHLTFIAVAEDSVQPDRPPKTKPVIAGAGLYDEFCIAAPGAP